MTDKQELRKLFPQFDQHELIQWLADTALFQEVPAESHLLQAGSPVRYVPLVLSGSIKVSRPDDQGREFFLYYIQPGETCAMTLNAGYKGEKSKINATTQDHSRLLLLPAHTLYDAGRRFPAWQRFAVEAFSLRYEELLQALESVIFQPLNERLQYYLAEKATVLQSRQLHISQQQIADDLNTSREVVSRLIRQLELQGLLRHRRGIVEWLG